MINLDNKIILNNTEAILHLMIHGVEFKDYNKTKINKLADYQEHCKTQQEIIHKEEEYNLYNQDNKP